MELRSWMKFVVLIAFFPCPAAAQSRDGKDMLKAILSGLKDIKEVGYSYAMSITYPDGNSQQLDGKVYVDNNNKQLFNENNLQTIVYTGKWSYKADHTEKEVVIVNNDKHVNKEHRKEMEKQLFENGSLGVFLDSIVMKRATVKSYRNSNDTIRIELSFPAGYAIRSINISYDNGHQKMVSYSMSTFYPWEGSLPGKKKGTTNNITCTNFSGAGVTPSFSIDKYFVLDNGKLALKKYNSYKLHSKL